MSELQHQPTDIPTIAVRRRVAMSDLMAFQGEALATSWAELQRTGRQQAGHPYVRYWEMGEGVADVEVGIPITRLLESSDLAGSLPGGARIVVQHDGPHDTLGDSYVRLAAAASEHELAGAPWEVYEWIPQHTAPDPAGWPAPTAWSTLLVQPVEAPEVDR